MISNFAWIESIDHRISAAVVFFVLMLLLNSGEKQPLFPLRAAASFAVMAAVSWVIRSLADVWAPNIHIQALGYSLQLLALHLLFVGASLFCYRVRQAVLIYNSLLALTIFKIAWNTFKTGSSIMLVNRMKALWGQYSVAGSLVSYLVYGSICLALCFLYRKLVKEPPYHAPVRVMIILSAVFLAVQMVLEYCGHVFTAEYSALFLYYLCALLYTVLNYAALLMIAAIDSFRHENRTMHDFISNKMRYYEMSHDGIVSLQTKCHDLKHQIAAIRSEAGKAKFDEYLNELEDSINEYATVIECGNQTVDIVLTEKNILCYSAHVKFSYMIDGSLFNFLTEREIYSLFGNALDNALEAVTKIEDPTLRMITLKSNTRGGLVVLQVENTYAGSMILGEDELPHTTKTGSGHGFGLRSIQRIAEKHGGMMSVRAENGVFKLSVVMDPRRAA
ncbi:MAG: GHKL domain-containing protein [Clostridia bacterium]|nr:GHKL domain-containing protein [Clostridia bacterium]